MDMITVLGSRGRGWFGDWFRGWFGNTGGLWLWGRFMVNPLFIWVKVGPTEKPFEK
jgi:hypothetical protein